MKKYFICVCFFASIFTHSAMADTACNVAITQALAKGGGVPFIPTYSLKSGEPVTLKTTATKLGKGWQWCVPGPDTKMSIFLAGVVKKYTNYEFIATRCIWVHLNRSNVFGNPFGSSPKINKCSYDTINARVTIDNLPILKNGDFLVATLNGSFAKSSQVPGSGSGLYSGEVNYLNDLLLVDNKIIDGFSID
jgi:hypothetical protein